MEAAVNFRHLDERIAYEAFNRQLLPTEFSRAECSPLEHLLTTIHLTGKLEEIGPIWNHICTPWHAKKLQMGGKSHGNAFTSDLYYSVTCLATVSFSLLNF